MFALRWKCRITFRGSSQSKGYIRGLSIQRTKCMQRRTPPKHLRSKQTCALWVQARPQSTPSGEGRLTLATRKSARIPFPPRSSRPNATVSRARNVFQAYTWNRRIGVSKSQTRIFFLKQAKLIQLQPKKIEVLCSAVSDYLSVVYGLLPNMMYGNDIVSALAY